MPNEPTTTEPESKPTTQTSIEQPEKGINILTLLGCGGLLLALPIGIMLFVALMSAVGLDVREFAPSIKNFFKGGFLTNSCKIPDGYLIAFNHSSDFAKTEKAINVPASLVAAIYSAGEHSGYSSFKVIDTAKNSTSTAQGPFQFLNGTWFGDGDQRGYHTDCGGKDVAGSIDQIKPDGDDDRNNIYDSACAAAWMLGADMKSQSGTVDEKAKKAIRLYRAGAKQDYPQRELEAINRYVEKVFDRYTLYNSCLDTSASIPANIAVKIVAAAKKEIGNRNLTNYSDGNTFVKYVYKQAGYEIDLSKGLQNSPSLNWYKMDKGNGTFKAESVKAGDIFSYDDGQTKGAGIVETVDKTKKTMKIILILENDNRFVEYVEIDFNQTIFWLGIGRLK